MAFSRLINGAYYPLTNWGGPPSGSVCWWVFFGAQITNAEDSIQVDVFFSHTQSWWSWWWWDFLWKKTPGNNKPVLVGNSGPVFFYFQIGVPFENSHAAIFNLQRGSVFRYWEGDFCWGFLESTESWNVMKCWYFVYNHPLHSSKLTLQSKMNHLKMYFSILKRKDFPVPYWFYRRVYYYDPKESNSPVFSPLFTILQKPWRRPTVRYDPWENVCPEF